MSTPPRPHLLARSAFARIADRAMALSWATPLHDRPPLDPAHIWAVGSKGFDTEDELACREPEDVEDFRERLDMLCRSLREEAQLSALGHAIAYGQLKAAVKMRHALGRMWRERPDLAQTGIADPLIVVGQMRSGTTRIHRLLAADPAFVGTRLCNSIEPAPRRPDTRPLRCAAGLALARRINPWIDAMHPFASTRHDEELGWLATALSPVAMEAQYAIPAFVAFSEGRDAAPLYREFARILRSDATVMGNTGLPRVLKCPQYAEDLAALLAQFPNARVIRTRRDASEVLASSLSVVASQMAYQSDHASLPAIEQEWRRKIDLREARMDAALGDFTGPVAEVDYAALSADWMAEIRRVYRELGLDVSPSALKRMRAEQDRAAHDPHKSHARSYRALAKA